MPGPADKRQTRPRAPEHPYLAGTILAPPETPRRPRGLGEDSRYDLRSLYASAAGLPPNPKVTNFGSTTLERDGDYELRRGAQVLCDGEAGFSRRVTWETFSAHWFSRHGTGDSRRFPSATERCPGPCATAKWFFMCTKTVAPDPTDPVIRDVSRVRSERRTGSLDVPALVPPDRRPRGNGMGKWFSATENHFLATKKTTSSRPAGEPAPRDAEPLPRPRLPGGNETFHRPVDLRRNSATSLLRLSRDRPGGCTSCGPPGRRLEVDVAAQLGRADSGGRG